MTSWCSRAIGARTSAAARTLARWLAAVIGSPRRRRAFPPRATTIRIRIILGPQAILPNLFVSIELSADIQAVKLQDRVQDETVAAPGLGPPDRVVREEHHVALLDRHVHHGRMLRDLLAVVDEARDEKILGVGVAQHDARPLGGWDDEDRVALLVVGQGHGLPELRLRLLL